ncbi:hypothetical protein BD626DRAFT_408719 [Schizophyllum amplum]|uniref:Uncharacterized protein n=1 Tax=Schizophyllum amplum TaxID=97359 RepID=A0A550C4J9_9AGAR|nr:hypothetical protein BD626DRAFT_408719 [Auriculariopsis ampla]
MSTSADIQLEWQLISLYEQARLRELPSISSPFHRRISLILGRPDLFRYLEGDPYAVPVRDWVPRSTTVMSVTTCLLALALIAESAVSTVQPNWAPVIKIASRVWPHVLRWIPFIHPAHGVLEPHPSHIRALVGILPVMYHVGVLNPSLREHTPCICRYIVSMWDYVSEHLQAGTKHEEQADSLQAIRFLGVCVRESLCPTATLSTEASSSDVRQEMVLSMHRRHDCLLMYLLRKAETLLECVLENALLAASALRVYLEIMSVLAQDVVVMASHLRPAIKLTVALTQRLPSGDLVAAACELMLGIWRTAHDNQPLVWSLRFGLVDVLRSCPSDGGARNIRAEIFSYIASRTAHRGVLRALLEEGHSRLLLGDGIAGNTRQARDIDETLLRRVVLMRSLCTSMCALETHRKILSRTGVVSRLDAGFVMLQVFQLLCSEKGLRTLHDLARIQEGHEARPSATEVCLEIRLDQLPPQHSIGRPTHPSSSGASSDLFLTIKIKLPGSRKTKAIVFEQVSLGGFINAIRSLEQVGVVGDQSLHLLTSLLQHWNGMRAGADEEAKLALDARI